MAPRDFSLEMYALLCSSISSSYYQCIRFQEYSEYKSRDEARFIMLRHDVDRSPYRALALAKIESEYGLKATYFFRMSRTVFIPELIQEINALGHEIGYHYETLTKTRGDVAKAILLFEQELKEFRNLAKVTSAAMHGSPLTPWNNRSIWDQIAPQEMDIELEDQKSIDYTDLLYFTDTGRTWDSTQNNLRDKVAIGRVYREEIKTTCELIDLIQIQKSARVCISAHPERWTETWVAWITQYGIDNMVNQVKYLLKYVYRVN